MVLIELDENIYKIVKETSELIDNLSFEETVNYLISIAVVDISNGIISIEQNKKDLKNLYR